jgi:dTDP-L-rhamnose 4-epimerase
MSDTVLVTGGAGFIGSHVVDLLLEEGKSVRVLDSLVEQVHREAGPRYVSSDAEFVMGDVRDRETLIKALQGVDRVIHLAAEVGVGQSMYEVSRYVDSNSGGTGVLLDVIASGKTDVRRIIVASSMSIYGEGAYRCPEHGLVAPGLRTESQLKARRWELQCPTCGVLLDPVPTPEDKALLPTSVYAISKMDQELLCLSVGAAYGVGVVALRYFNAYGPRQALSNPYTGVAAIFSARLLNGRAPLAFEDGQQLRDFIHVRDVARATVIAMESEKATGRAVNVGVGSPLTIMQVGQLLSKQLGADRDPEVTGKFRVGDIRHCWADPTRADELLGFTAEIPLETGIAELIDWVSTQKAEDHIDKAYAELGQRGLALLWSASIPLSSTAARHSFGYS